MTFDESILASTANPSSIVLETAEGAPVLASVTASARTATLTPSAALSAGQTSTVTVKGGDSGITDRAGNELAADLSWSFTVRVAAPARTDPTVGPGGPVLVVNAGGFGSYLPENMRAEGLNKFTVGPQGDLSASGLAAYDSVLLGAAETDTDQVTALTAWVEAGGDLIALRPDAELASLLGLSDPAGTLSEGYLMVDTSAAPGTGIVSETMQFHGTADLFTAAAGTQVVATLYSNATDPAGHPAVTRRDVGANGGSASAFTYDLARSVVLTRQGNPAWASMERDGFGPTGQTTCSSGPWPPTRNPTTWTWPRSRSRRPTSSSGCWRTS